MSRRKHPRTPRVSVPIARLEAIVEQTRIAALPADDHATLKAAVDTLARLTAELETTTTTLERVRRLIFGPRTETTDTVLGKNKDKEKEKDTGQTDPTAPPPPDPATTPDGAPAGDPQRKRRRRGHGRNGAAKYPRAPRIVVTHATLKHGAPCPESGCTGRVYVQRQEPALLVRVTGVAPIGANLSHQAIE
jgi:hypothetical protein